MDCNNFIDLAIRIMHIEQDETIEDQLIEDFDGHLTSCEKCAAAYDALFQINLALTNHAEEIFCKGFPENVVESTVQALMKKADEHKQAGDFESASRCYDDVLILKPSDAEATKKSIYVCELDGKKITIPYSGQKLVEPLPESDNYSIYRNTFKLCDIELQPQFGLGMMDSDEGLSDKITKVYEDDFVLIETKQGIKGNFLVITPKK